VGRTCRAYWGRRNMYEGLSRSFWTDSVTKYTLTAIDTRWEATQRVMAEKLTRLTHKIAETCTICSSNSRQPVWKLLDMPSYMIQLSSCSLPQTVHSPTSSPHLVQRPKLYSGCNSYTPMSSHFLKQFQHKHTNNYYWDERDEWMMSKNLSINNKFMKK